jgi:hypothetical protein
MIIELRSGMKCKTLKDEKDIELIPAGTEVTLDRPNGNLLWACHGIINSENRSLLIFTNNLSPVSA